MDIETRCIHGNNQADKHSFGSIVSPIYQAATFSHPEIGVSTGHNYSRESNPTREVLEALVSDLEGACDTVACSSGMAAITLCMELFSPGAHIICTEDLYGGSVRLFESIGKKNGLEYSFVDTGDLEVLKAEIKPNTKALFIETPSNPMMKVTDLQAVSSLAKEYGLRVIVDNTFMSPYLQRPLELGADIVLQSGTKYLGGHNDTISGLISCKDKETAERVRTLSVTLGNVLAPFDCFLMIRGIKTLAIRMERAQENAIALAKWLKKQDSVKDVYYVGLPDSPGYEINQNQSDGFGAMISFRTETKALAYKILKNIKVFTFAESLGGVESLITYPITQTHSAVPEDARQRLGITDTLLRMSVGIENIDDLIADLDQALNG